MKEKIEKPAVDSSLRGTQTGFYRFKAGLPASDLSLWMVYKPSLVEFNIVN